MSASTTAIRRSVPFNSSKGLNTLIDFLGRFAFDYSRGILSSDICEYLTNRHTWSLLTPQSSSGQRTPRKVGENNDHRRSAEHTHHAHQVRWSYVSIYATNQTRYPLIASSPIPVLSFIFARSNFDIPDLSLLVFSQRDGFNNFTLRISWHRYSSVLCSS